jgi:hypothetical protein
MVPVNDQLLAQLAVSQHGLVTRAQALGLLTERQLEQRLASGRLVRVRPGVYRFAGAVPTWHQSMLAACLAAGTDAAVAGLAAAAVWRMPGIARDAPELVIPSPRWVRLRSVRAHRGDRLFKHHTTVRDGVPVTTAARTLFDLSAAVGPFFLGKLVNSSLRRHITTIGELHRCCDELATRGRRRLTVVRSLLEVRPLGFDPGDSDPELELLNWLRAAGLPRPVQQHPVQAGRRLFVLDLAYPVEKIAIEYDSWEFHGNRLSFDRDSRRRTALDLAGWTNIGVTPGWTRREFLDAVRTALTRSCRDVGTSQGV